MLVTAGTLTPLIWSIFCEKAATFITGIANHKHFKRGKGPRKLSGTASDGGGLFQVYFRLRRFSHSGCQWYSSKRSVFTNKQAHCTARYQRLGTDAKWSYLLPARLPHIWPNRLHLVLPATSMSRKRHESVMSSVIGRGVSNGSLCLLPT